MTAWLFARATRMTPSSSGSRSASSTEGGNSPSSSRKRTPPWARLISPGRSEAEPPPTRATTELVWCGARNGGVVTSPPRGIATPAAEWIIVAASASARSSAGKTPVKRCASIVLPEPGAPTSSRWWPPAAAISRACRATGWPRTSARSGGGGASSPTGGPGSTGHGVSVVRHVTTSFSVDATRTDRWRRRGPRGSTRSARRPPDRRARPPSAQPREHGAASRPDRARRRTRARRRPPAGSPLDATSTPIAIARSSPAPVLRRPDGARLTVMHADRPGQLAAQDGGSDPVAGFSTRRVRQADDVVAGEAGTDVDLDGHRVAAGAEECGRRDGCEHGALRRT